ncbi:hypothetical protein C8T65DRAFT_301960 [Cerioporus squamosus]|nr:hypothetical protein C8T65DRAFT_301960 [Cerioporus squamosus]
MSSGFLLTFTTQNFTYDKWVDFHAHAHDEQFARRLQRRTEILSSGSGLPMKAQVGGTASVPSSHRAPLFGPFICCSARGAPTDPTVVVTQQRLHPHQRPHIPTEDPQASLYPQRPHVPWRPERRGERFRLDVRLPRMMHPRFFPWMRAARRDLRPCTN